MGCVSRHQQANYRWLDKHSRLHAQHGPIDLIIQADGDHAERVLAFEQAVAFFDSVLVGLVSEIVHLRKSVTELTETLFQSVVAQQMHRTTGAFDSMFVTPMAAVAGSVADCTLAAMCKNRKLDRASVNNGGDIALYLTKGSHYTVGVCESPFTNATNAHAQIDATSRIRGVATSGWHGRSHSLGIADAVTVLASSAALADTAATLIANQIDLPGSAKIERVAAVELAHDSDLGSLAVTVDVKPLTLSEKHRALLQGQSYAQSLVSQGLIYSAFMSLQGQRTVAGHNHLVQRRQSA